MRQGQFGGFHFFIEVLKAFKQFICFSSSGNEFHVFGPNTLMLSLPLRTVLTLGIAK